MTEHVHHADGPSDCYGCKLRQFNFAPSCMPTRNPTVANEMVAERRLKRDLPAYKRMVDSGLQPKATRGAADLEARAHEGFEVERNMVVKDRHLRKRLERGIRDTPAELLAP